VNESRTSAAIVVVVAGRETRAGACSLAAQHRRPTAAPSRCRGSTIRSPRAGGSEGLGGEQVGTALVERSSSVDLIRRRATGESRSSPRLAGIAADLTPVGLRERLRTRAAPHRLRAATSVSLPSSSGSTHQIVGTPAASVTLLALPQGRESLRVSPDGHGARRGHHGRLQSHTWLLGGNIGTTGIKRSRYGEGRGVARAPPLEVKDDRPVRGRRPFGCPWCRR